MHRRSGFVMASKSVKDYSSPSFAGIQSPFHFGVVDEESESSSDENFNQHEELEEDGVDMELIMDKLGRRGGQYGVDTSLMAKFKGNSETPDGDSAEHQQNHPHTAPVSDDLDPFKFDSATSPNKNLAVGGKMKTEKKLSVSEKSPSMPRKASKDSLKALKQSYRQQQKRRTKELSSALKDPSVIILSSWLKVRGTLKGWTKFWCVVKPGMLIIYKSSKSGQWVGTVLLNGCEILERPSKKEGFCFKIYQPLEHYIWATRGPKGEIAGSIVQPMPKDYLILRASTESDGRCWMDAIEVAQKQGYDLQRDNKGMLSELYGKDDKEDRDEREEPENSSQRWFRSLEDRDDDSVDGMDSDNELDDTMDMDRKDPDDEDILELVQETTYVPDNGEEYLGQAGEATEEIEDENKSILWALLKQIKPGMDLSRVTLPTFILEPRSFLDKLSDYYYHTDILSRAAHEDCAYIRMKEVVRWYLSGFYKKPKGLKKPYNPIIGETFRCYWSHPTGTKTFFVSEQVSHHPPVSAFYISNRQEGFVVNGAILAKSKFYGNSSSAILDGSATLSLLRFGEEYIMTMPYAHCKGILIGTLTLELGGLVTISCEKTGYHAEIEFKLKPFWKNVGESNHIACKIKMEKETLCKFEGKWDGEIVITDLKDMNHADEEPLPELFWEPTPDIREQRLKRHLVELGSQGDYESEKLWQHVGVAIRANDQENATKEKFALEEEQRKGHRERKEQGVDWIPKLFERDPAAPNCINRWLYKHRDVRTWDNMTDLQEYEFGGVIKTKYRLKAPMVRTTSILNVQVPDSKKSGKRKRPSSSRSRGSKMSTSRRNSIDRSGASTPDPEAEHSSSVEDDDESLKGSVDMASFEKMLQPLRDMQKDCVTQMRAIRSDLRRHYNSHQDEISSLQFKDWVLILLLIIAQGLFQWYYR